MVVYLLMTWFLLVVEHPHLLQLSLEGLNHLQMSTIRRSSNTRSAKKDVPLHNYNYNCIYLLA